MLSDTQLTYMAGLRLRWVQQWLQVWPQPQATLRDYEVISHSNATSSDHGIVTLDEETSESTLSSNIYPPLHTYPSRWYDTSASFECFHLGWFSYEDAKRLEYFREIERFKPELSDGISYAEAVDYEIAGRADNGNVFRDLRSPAKARRRLKAESEKYFAYKEFKRGDVGKLHCNPARREWGYQRLLPDAEIVCMTKRDLYQQAQCWPKPPRYHRGRRHRQDEFWTSRAEMRSKAGKHARRHLAGYFDQAVYLNYADYDLHDAFCPCGDILHYLDVQYGADHEARARLSASKCSMLALYAPTEAADTLDDMEVKPTRTFQIPSRLEDRESDIPVDERTSDSESEWNII